ncbi:MAG: zinc-dependent alcohol dehydrogenase [Acidimicrobiia bacterium]
MKALVLEAPGSARLVERPDPDPTGRALVRVHRVGVCGTDASIFDGKIKVAYPLIMGHEMVGVVETPGPRSLVPAGATVMVDPSLTCGYCPECRADRANLCRNGGLLGRDVDGVFADYLAVPETLLHPLPESIRLDEGPLLQVMGTCVHAQSMFSVFPGDTAVVIGLGVTGFLHLQLLAARGLHSIVAVTRSEWKQQMALNWGASAAVGSAQARETIEEVSGGVGAAVVVECAGHESTLAQAIELAGAGGTVVAFGTITHANSGLPYYRLYHKELTVLNPRAALPRDYARAVALAAEGAVDLTPLVTHRLALDQAPGALADLINDPAALKIVFELG